MTGFHTLRSGDNGNAQSAKDAGYFLPPDIDSQSGFAYPLHPADRWLIMLIVFQLDFNHPLRLFPDHLVIGDKTLFFQDSGDGEF